MLLGRMGYYGSLSDPFCSSSLYEFGPTLDVRLLTELDPRMVLLFFDHVASDREGLTMLRNCRSVPTMHVTALYSGDDNSARSD